MHQKHPKLARPSLGAYGRTEFALVGSTCERMEALMADWVGRFSDRYRCLTVVGEHGEPEEPVSLRYGRKRFATPEGAWNDYDDRLLGQQFDLVFVNGNHYPASRQIVFVDAKKAGTLERRREQLTDIFAVVYVEGDNSIPTWLSDKCSLQHRPPIMTSLSMLTPLLSAMEEELAKKIPRLRALVLAGGASSRMGTDKARIVYRNNETELQRLTGLCVEVSAPPSISVRQRSGEDDHAYPLVEDRFLGLGPAGAICSAFLTDPDAAWLVLACDLPLLDETTLTTLVEARDPSRYATALRGPDNQWPEPLVAIYEPRAYPRLLQFLSLGYSCPRKLLINTDVKVVDLADGTPLTNANTPEEREQVRELLS